MQLARAPVLLVAFVLSGCGSGDEAARGSGRRVSPVVTHAAQASSSPAPGAVLVDVGGAVRRPGVYELAAGARVHDAIVAAGGLTGEADVATLNRAAKVVDGQQVLVPRRGDDAPATGAGAAQPAASTTVSINSADAAALDSLPGIGPVTAERIVADRTANGPFATIDDLDRVPGIGPGTIEELRAVAGT